MKILFVGDIAGRTGRDAFFQHIGALKTRFAPDAVIVNVDNASHGFGVTAKIADELLAGGADILTGGNHVWDQREMLVHIGRYPNLLRPLNLPPGTPGNGVCLLDAKTGGRLLVVHVLGRLFMDPVDCPFRAVDDALKNYAMGRGLSVFVDVHAEATSEKMALAHHLDGRVSAVVGTHTHIPTADTWILPGGTAYQTDAGMTGDFHSVIGMKKELAVPRFVRKMPGEKLAPAEGEATLCGTFVETDDATGKAISIVAVRVGGLLPQTL